MNNKKKYGQYFTQQNIADFMVSLIDKDHDCRILEPSCGEGVFLKSLHKHDFMNIHAYEIDSNLSRQYDCVEYTSFLSSPISDKYDVVIGNPPYIRWKNLEPELKEELAHNSLWNHYFNSLCDYLFIFILKSIEHLKDGGELIFICTEYWMNTTHSVSLRNYMCDHGYISELYHFKEAPLFEGVTASFIIFKYVKQPEISKDIQFFFYKDKGLPSLDSLISHSCFDEKRIPQFRKNDRWLLATELEQQELKNFEQVCEYNDGLFSSSLHRVGDVCDIGNGMVSGLDKAFYIADTTELTDKEQKHLIPVLKAKDLDAYNYLRWSMYIFMPEDLKEEDFCKDFPHFYTQLSIFQQQLNERYQYNRYIPYWSFVFPRNQKLFERKEEKIFVPCKERISNKSFFRFCLAPEGFYPLQDVTCIVRKKTCRESIEYILAYLNNYRIFNWLQFNGIVKGAIVEFSEAPLASIPYRPILWDNAEEVHLHDEITTHTRSYLKDKDKSHLSIIEQNFNKLFL